MCAIAHALINSGRSVLYQPTFKLVQDLLVAKRYLQLPRVLHTLDMFGALLIDGIGYVRIPRITDNRSRIPGIRCLLRRVR